MHVDWVKCESGTWCNFLQVNLNHQHFNNLEGIYIIWHGGQNPAVVYVGQGVIRDRLSAHRNERSILQYQDRGLYATWAVLPRSVRDGVEKFLYDYLKPKAGEKCPDCIPIPVNTPWTN